MERHLSIGVAFWIFTSVNFSKELSVNFIIMDQSIVLPSKPRIVREKDNLGVYEIDCLYPGYGHTLGNSLRRIILSSLPGAAITSVKIEGVSHEFSTIEGVKEDVIVILLNLKKLRFRLSGDEPVTAKISVKGPKDVTSGDIEMPGQAEIFDKSQHIATITNKSTTLEITLTIEKGLGYVPKEMLHKDKVEIGSIAIDATFTPIKRVNYEVENMRVGDRTDFNRLRLHIETDGVITPREVLEKSIIIMINQLKAIVGFKEEEVMPESRGDEEAPHESSDSKTDASKVKIDEAGFSSRTANALLKGGIKTLSGLARKSKEDLLELDGLGEKAISEIRDTLKGYGLTLKE